MKKKIILIISCVLTPVLLIWLLVAACNITEEKRSAERFGDFLNEKEYDVLFLGSDRMKSAVLPMELWDKYGITSYNLGVEECGMDVSYYLLREALSYGKTDTVVIDGYAVKSDYSRIRTDRRLHDTLDAFPMSIGKLKASLKLLGNSELFFNYPICHSRWDKLTANDFKPYMSPLKGAEPYLGVGEPNAFDIVDTGDNFEYSKEYLNRIITLCKENNIDVILTYLPVDSQNTDGDDLDKVKNVASDNDITFVDLSDYEEIREATDYNPETGCFNYSGAFKVTNFFGTYFKDNKSFEDKRENEKYAKWNADHEAYMDYKLNTLLNTDNVYDYMNLIDDENYNLIINFADDYVLKDSMLRELVRELGGEDYLDKTEKFRLYVYMGEYTETLDIDIELPKNTPSLRIEVHDNKKHEIIDTVRIFLTFETDSEGNVKIVGSNFVRGEVIADTDNIS